MHSIASELRPRWPGQSEALLDSFQARGELTAHVAAKESMGRLSTLTESEFISEHVVGDTPLDHAFSQGS